VGEIDTNVDPASTLQVANALIQADKDFDLLFIPGAGHGSGGQYGARKRNDFFVQHLLGITPPDWNTGIEIMGDRDAGAEDSPLLDMLDPMQQVPGFFSAPDDFDLWWQQ
jgi:hypothetical protein